MRNYLAIGLFVYFAVIFGETETEPEQIMSSNLESQKTEKAQSDAKNYENDFKGTFARIRNLSRDPALISHAKKVFSMKSMPYQSLKAAPPTEPFLVKLIVPPMNESDKSALPIEIDEIEFTNQPIEERDSQSENTEASPAREKIKQRLKGKKVFLSFSVNPKRLPNLHKVLEQLDTELIDKIFICIPKYFHNNNSNSKEGRYSISINLLSRFPKIRILQSSYDIGPFLKLLGSCFFLKEQCRLENAFVIYLDDDNLYPRWTIDSLLQEALDNPNCAIGGSGLLFGNEEFELPPTNSSSERKSFLYPANILEGFASVIVPIELVDHRLIFYFCDWVTPSSTFSDDLIISWVLEYSGVNLYGINSNAPSWYLSKAKVSEFSWAKIGSLSDLSHDNSKESGFGGNFKRYKEALSLIRQVAIDPERQHYLSKDKIIDLLDDKKEEQIKKIKN